MNRALFYRKFGRPEQVLTLECLNKLTIKENCIRVQMLYAPINASDLIPITGAYQHRITLPQIAGYEGIGKSFKRQNLTSNLLANEFYR